MTTTLRLPAKHAGDWFSRLGSDLGAQLVAQTARTITLTLTDEQLADLRADAEHYVEVMHGENTDGIDYRPAARRCLAAIATPTA